ncbi:MAG: bifunctional DNA primase/polymerase, partial [Chloroflexota bacterium]|nr:bifunctional DNA primase/polymerase [Chloroflexota bacterium]
MTPPTTREAARSYLARGWAVVPVPYRAKRPVLKDWQHLRPMEEDLARLFPGGPQNIGVLLGEPSGGVDDVDLDSLEARALANLFLPPTPCVFGRASTPRSHRLYRSDDPIKTTKFRDPTKPQDDARAMLVELRSTGTQTLVPPSLHPSGEPVTWAENGDPALVAAAELVSMVARLAAAALLVRHWPGRGARQDAALALAGGLLRAGWVAEDVVAFIETVAAAAGDEEARKRGEAVRSTAGALTSGDPTTGWPTLTELLDAKVVERVRAWLGTGQDGGRQTGSGGATWDEEEAAGESHRGREPAQATLLVELAREEGIELFHDAQGEPFASFVVDGHRETWPLRSKTVRHYLARLFFLSRGRAPGSQALQDALQVLDGEARFAGAEHPVAVRLADHAGTLYLDLGDRAWRIVAISPAGWKILAPEACPVRF